MQTREQDRWDARPRPDDDARERLARVLKSAFPLPGSGSFGSLPDAISTFDENRTAGRG